MSEKNPADQEEKFPSGDLIARQSSEADWNSQFKRAGTELILSERQGESRASSGSIRWIRAALPLAGVVLYLIVIYVIIPNQGSTPSFTSFPESPQSLSGASIERDPIEELNEEALLLVRELDQLFRQRRFREILTEIASIEEEQVASHPIIQTIGLLAENRLGGGDYTLERELLKLEERLQAERKKYPELFHELQLAKAELILNRSQSPELLARQTDTIFRLLDYEIKDQRDIEVRLKAAHTYENAARFLFEQATGITGLRIDMIKMKEARIFYQSALRLIVKEGDWKRATPISEGARDDVSRLIGHIEICNRKIHGPALPFSGKDSSTWSGDKGTAIHDNLPDS